MSTEAELALSAETLFHRRHARPGLCLDIGAHEGDFVAGLLDLPGLTWLAVEPLPHALRKLRERAAQSGGRVEVAGVALSDTPGTARLAVPVLRGSPVWQWASMAKDFAALQTDHPEIVDIQFFDIEVTTLDSLMAKRNSRAVTALKLDAEGAEYQVLRGGRSLLRTARPIISVELEERHQTGCTYAVPAFLDALGYACYFELAGELQPFARFDRATMQQASRSPASHDYSDPYVNCFYFLPVEKEAELLALPAKPIAKERATRPWQLWRRPGAAARK